VLLVGINPAFGYRNGRGCTAGAQGTWGMVSGPSRVRLPRGMGAIVGLACSGAES